MTDAREQSLEYARLTEQLDLPQLERQAMQWHAADRIFDGTGRLPHLHEVAELARRYASRVWSQADPLEQRYRSNLCFAAGLLHDSILTGRSYEELVSVADCAVATIVSQLTPDYREPRGRRAMLLSNRIGLADTEVKLVKLADLTLELPRYAKQPEKHDGWLTEAAAAADGLEALLEEDNRLHQPLLAVRESIETLLAARSERIRGKRK